MSVNNTALRDVTVDFIDISAAEAEPTRNMWVFNNISRLRRTNGERMDGTVAFSIMLNATQEKLIRIPYTAVPVNIGLQAPKKLILDSANFLECLNRNILRLVSDATAQRAFVQSEEARIEQDRVAQMLSSNTIGMVDREQQLISDNIEEIEGAIDPDINVRIAEAVGREDIKEGEFMAIMRNLDVQNSLSRKDLQYVLDDAKHVKVRTYAQNRLSGSHA